ncbi:ATP-binding protein, partial [Bacillus tropicus]
VEAIEDRGLIRIKLYKREANVIFEVIDDGPGIAQKYKKLVFK